MYEFFLPNIPFSLKLYHYHSALYRPVYIQRTTAAGGVIAYSNIPKQKKGKKGLEAFTKRPKKILFYFIFKYITTPPTVPHHLTKLLFAYNPSELRSSNQLYINTHKSMKSTLIRSHQFFFICILESKSHTYNRVQLTTHHHHRVKRRYFVLLIVYSNRK